MTRDLGSGRDEANGEDPTCPSPILSFPEGKETRLESAASACGREGKRPLEIEGLVLSPHPHPSPLMRLWREQMSQAGRTAQTPPSCALGEDLAEGRNWHAGPQKDLGAPSALAGPELTALASWPAQPRAGGGIVPERAVP